MSNYEYQDMKELQLLHFVSDQPFLLITYQFFALAFTFLTLESWSLSLNPKISYVLRELVCTKCAEELVGTVAPPLTREIWTWGLMVWCWLAPAPFSAPPIFTPAPPTEP